MPPIALCTDNAAMIASAARYVPALPYPDYLALDAYATGERPLTVIVSLRRPGCHLCEDARAMLVRAGPTPLRGAATSRPTTCSSAAISSGSRSS